MTSAGTSYWRESAPPLSTEPLTRDVTCDVAIVGAGITGVSMAWELTQRGTSVVLLEASRLGGVVTGNSTAKLSAHHGLIYAELKARKGSEAARMYADSQTAAIRRVVEIVSGLGIDCDLEPRTSYVWAESERTHGQLEAEARAAAEAGLDAELVTTTDLPFPVLGAVRVAGQMQFHPLKYLSSLVDDVVGAGAEVFEQTRVVRLEEGDPSVLTTQGGHRVRATDVVVATHSPIFDRSLLFARLVPRREVVIAGPIDGAGPDGIYLTPDDDTRSIRTASTPDGRLAIVTGQKFRPGTRPTSEAFAELEAWARERLALTSVSHRWAAQDNFSPDSLPFVGPLYPLAKHAWVATGFGGWGMSSGVMAAGLLAARISGKAPGWSDLYDTRRLDPFREAGPMVKAQLEVAGHFVGDRLAALRAGGDGLEPGMGRVITVSGRPVAVARDGAGQLHSVAATCSHLGCLVQHNDAEQSWDCPCHGSRFDLDGTVLNGPAVRPLKRVDLD